MLAPAAPSPGAVVIGDPWHSTVYPKYRLSGYSRHTRANVDDSTTVGGGGTNIYGASNGGGRVVRGTYGIGEPAVLHPTAFL